MAGSASLLKRLLLGRPFRSDETRPTELPKRLALPIFASDPLSTAAYAPAQILMALSAAGAAAFAYAPWVAVAVAVVVLVVAASYRQTVRAYPSGGGDYEVAADNLGTVGGLIVASALLVDYMLTVAVSVAPRWTPRGARRAGHPAPDRGGGRGGGAAGGGEPARGTAAGAAVRRPDLPVPGRDGGDGGLGAVADRGAR